MIITSIPSPKLKYDALKDPTKDQELLIQGQGFVGTDIPGVEGMYVIREKGTGSCPGYERDEALRPR